jgi:hypothetical protein
LPYRRRNHKAAADVGGIFLMRRSPIRQLQSVGKSSRAVCGYHEPPRGPKVSAP